MDGGSGGAGHAEDGTPAGLRLISAATGLPEAGAGRLRRDPGALERGLADPRVFEMIFGAESLAVREAIIASPFLAFAVAVHRAAADLAEVRYVAERSAARQQVPLFDAPELRDFLGSAARRLFLAKLLTSFTRVTSSRYRVTVGGRSRARRFSELDPVRLAGMLEAVPEESRPGVYRRLGDVALFLSGVFPDYVAGQAFSPVNVARLLRATHVPASERERLGGPPDLGPVGGPGPRWYRSGVGR